MFRSSEFGAFVPVVIAAFIIFILFVFELVTGAVSGAGTYEIRSDPRVGAEVVGMVDHLDCADIDHGAAPRVFDNEGVWYRIGGGWVHNDGWCI